MNKQRRGLNRYNVLRDRWRHWKSEAKEDHQLSSGGPSNRRKMSVITSIHFPHVDVLWNKLPADIVGVSDLVSFKTAVSKIKHVHP